MDWAAEVLNKRPDEIAKAFGEKTLTVPLGLPGSDLRYVTFENKGIQIVLTNEVATCVHLYGAGANPKYAEYAGPLPGNLQFTNSRAAARQALGPPAHFEDGAPGRGLLGRTLLPWDTWLSNGQKVHFEYWENAASIRLVSIMTLDD